MEFIKNVSVESQDSASSGGKMSENGGKNRNIDYLNKFIMSTLMIFYSYNF